MEWCQDLARIEEMRKGAVLGRKVMNWLNIRYQFVKKGMLVVSLLLKMKIQPGSTRIWWFVDNCTKVRQNALFLVFLRIFCCNYYGYF